jgi:hypothetical protein
VIEIDCEILEEIAFIGIITVTEYDFPLEMLLVVS